jgi:hypothetical protein
MSWQTDWLAAFGTFTRPIQYSRPDGPSANLPGFASMEETTEVAGDFTSKTCLVTISASAMIAAGLYPPQEYDRVDLNDGIPRVVGSFKIAFVQNAPQFVKLKVSG